MHLFNGRTEKGLDEATRQHGHLVMNADIDQNLTNPNNWVYLLKLIRFGKVYGILGGKTYSLCRHFPPGPRPLRSGYDDTPSAQFSIVERAHVDEDDGLFLTILVLYALATIGS